MAVVFFIMYTENCFFHWPVLITFFCLDIVLTYMSGCNKQRCVENCGTSLNWTRVH